MANKTYLITLKLFVVGFVFMLFFSKINAKDIVFENLTAISPFMAEQILDLQKPYTDKSINKYIKKLYKLGYFNQIKVKRDAKSNNIVFVFDEKYSIINLQIKGYKTKKEDLEQLYEIMGIKKGSLYDEAKIKKAKITLLAVLQSEGYYDSVIDIDTKLIANTGYDLIFNVNKGYEIIITKLNYNIDNKSALFDFDDVTMNKEKQMFSWFFGQNDGVLNAAAFGQDEYQLANLYRQNGYIDVLIKPVFGVIDFSTFEATLEYNIESKTKYKVGKTMLVYDKTLFSDVLSDYETKLKKNDVFNVDNLKADIQTIKHIVAIKGYAYSDVQYDINKDLKTKSIEVVYKLFHKQKVYVNDVIIKGNTKTLDSAIRRWVYLAPKDLFNKNEISSSINKLKRSGYFSNVKIDTNKISDDKIDIIVTVEEAKTGTLRGSGGYGSIDGGFISLEVSDGNFLGSGMNIAITTTYAKLKRKIQFSISNPSINDGIYSGRFKIYETKTEDRYTQEVDFTHGVSFGLGRSIGKYISAGAVYSYDKTKTSENLSEYHIDDDVYVTSSIKPYINFDNTDDYYVPRSGIKTGVSSKITGVGGDVSYVHNYGYFSAFYGLKPVIDMDIILQFKSKANAINKGVGVYPRLYLGGPKSIRGYRHNIFGSDQRYTKNYFQTIELSFPLMPKAKMRLQLFYDYGLLGIEKWNKMEIDKKSYGLNISWFSPMGPVNFVFGRAIDSESDYYEEKFIFDIGKVF